jgi:hypothetical protein|tara:strand:+ start:149 stop:376 length:228 start_codon:yes stop_codon:yes gene_type:complete
MDPLGIDLLMNTKKCTKRDSNIGDESYTEIKRLMYNIDDKRQQMELCKMMLEKCSKCSLSDNDMHQIIMAIRNKN